MKTPKGTQRLAFRCWQETDESLARLLWGDPRLAAAMGPGYRIPEEEVLARLAREVACGREYGIQYWPLFLKETGELVGCCGIRPHGEDGATVEMGFHLRPPFWKQGLGAESAHAVLEYAFSGACPYPVQTVWIGHHPSNHASQQLIQKLGFNRVGWEDYPSGQGSFPFYQMTGADWNGQKQIKK